MNVRSATFSRNLRQDLNRSINDRYSADEVRRQLNDFEMALVQLRNRVNSRQVIVIGRSQRARARSVPGQFHC